MNFKLTIFTHTKTYSTVVTPSNAWGMKCSIKGAGGGIYDCCIVNSNSFHALHYHTLDMHRPLIWPAHFNGTRLTNTTETKITCIHCLQK